MEPSLPSDGPSFQPFHVDDVVKVISDAVMVKRMQKGHGEWVESMREVKCCVVMDGCIMLHTNQLQIKAIGLKLLSTNMTCILTYTSVYSSADKCPTL